MRAKGWKRKESKKKEKAKRKKRQNVEMVVKDVGFEPDPGLICLRSSALTLEPITIE
jgi:hypothetical protein